MAKLRVPPYRPKELIEFEYALDLLRFLARPNSGGSFTQISKDHAVDQPIPDPNGKAWRDDLERIRKELEREANEIVHAILSKTPRQPRHKRGDRCPICQTSQRRGAHYCDQCGHSLDDDSRKTFEAS